MDGIERGFDEGGDRGQGDQFHRNEAISAVADEGFLGEDDNEYEDLYNDVNVGDGFLQSLRKNNDSGFGSEEEKKNEVAMVAQDPGVSIPGVGAVGDGGPSVERLTEGYNQSQGSRGNNMGMGGEIGSNPLMAGGGGIRVELGQGSKINEIEGQSNNTNTGVQGIGQHHPQQQIQQQQQPQQTLAPSLGGVIGNVGIMDNDNFARQGGGGGNVNGLGGNGLGNAGGGGGSGGGSGTILFVGDLHWWTTDAELEAELCKYGPVKEVKFFDEKASGKSKGYCQVEFYDASAATACKEGLNGHSFNGRPCVVAFASPYSVKRMGEAQVNRSQQTAQSTVSQTRRGPNDVQGKPGENTISIGSNYQGGDNGNSNSNNNNNNRGFGRGNWGRGNVQGMGNRGPVGLMRNRGGAMGGRGIMGNGGNGFGLGIGAAPHLLHQQAMMAQGFDPSFGASMGRMGPYGGFPGAPAPPFSGILSSFPPVGGVGLPGVAPHVNPAFFGRGMPMNGMGMMPTPGVDGPNMGMWADPSMGGWMGEEHGSGRAGQSSYGEEAGSEHQYGEVSHERGGWQNTTKEKDRGSEREWSGSSDRKYRDDREPGNDKDMPREKGVGRDHEQIERRHRDERESGRDGDKERERDRELSRSERDRDRDRHKEDRDRYVDHHRHRDRVADHEDEWERGRSSRTHSKSRLPHEEDHRSRSRDADYGKRRRLTSE